MSLTRALFNEFRPFFRVLDDPFMASADPFAIAPRHRHRRSRHPRQEDDILSQLGLGFPEVRTPRVQVTEEDNSYVVNAEVPGIKKEELDVSVGDGGRSLTIQAESSSGTPPASAATPVAEATQDASTSTTGTEGAAETSMAVTQHPGENQLSTETAQPQRWSSYSFSRTIWLPRPVDAAHVSAKLDHGILTLRIPKKEEAEAQKISIE